MGSFKIRPWREPKRFDSGHDLGGSAFGTTTSPIRILAGKPEPATKCKRELSGHFAFDKPVDSFFLKGGVKSPQVRSFLPPLHNLFIFL